MPLYRTLPAAMVETSLIRHAAHQHALRMEQGTEAGKQTTGGVFSTQPGRQPGREVQGAPMAGNIAGMAGNG